jgi:hypothetical protein
MILSISLVEKWRERDSIPSILLMILSREKNMVGLSEEPRRLEKVFQIIAALES